MDNMKKSKHELALELVEMLRPTIAEMPIHRSDAAQRLGISERNLRRARQLAEIQADFAIGIRNGYARLYLDREIAAEIKYRQALRISYTHIRDKHLQSIKEQIDFGERKQA